MVITLFGFIFIVWAIQDLTGWKHSIPPQYRNASWRKAFQRGRVLPELFIGAIWAPLSLLVPDHSSPVYIGGLILSAAAGIYMLHLNKKKYIK